MTGTSASTHPAWCDDAQCDAEGLQLHHSRAIDVPAEAGADRDSARYVVSIYGTHHGQPLLELSIVPATSGPVSPVFDIGADQLRRLRAALAAAGHVLDADQPHLASLNHPDDQKGGVPA
ncbi:hypothetical protein [Dactylosporangium sp. CA-139066]|uniref:hypothetical protein n=1 Tax=Dactylosporangium sp. CA-139066 TaxID=3239930 RepID=UPI003D8F4BDA